MKELWTNDNPNFKSERWTFSDLKFSPKPLQSPHIPLWIGGASVGALNRAARHGDGWHPSGIGPEDYSINREYILEKALSLNRDLKSFTWSARVEVEAHGGASSQRSEQRSRISGNSASDMIASISEYQNSGVEHIVLALNTGDVTRIKDLMSCISREVIPNFN